jgi:hypothetical protein
VTRFLLAAAVVAVLLAGVASAASAATVLHSPKNGAVIHWKSGFVWFDWRWGAGEYAGGVYIGRTRNFRRMHLLNEWDVASNTSAYIDSRNGDIRRPGVYYWTVCAQTITGEDDRCYLHAPIRRFTVVR